MSEAKLNFFSRLSLAFSLFFRTAFNPDFAALAQRLREGKPASGEPARSRSAAAGFKEPLPEAALQLLGLLQQEGRFIDFLEEDVAGFSDTEIGAAARVIHQGCRKVMHDHFTIVPVRPEEEGSRIMLEEGFNPASVRLTGNVVGRAPFHGCLVHRGWRVAEVKLPRLAEGHETRILAAAEVEL